MVGRLENLLVVAAVDVLMAEDVIRHALARARVAVITVETMSRHIGTSADELDQVHSFVIEVH